MADNKKWFTREVPLSSIKSPLHPRTFRESGIADLAKSIDRVLMAPIVVDDDMQLIAGQRRVLAARLLGWKTIPARIIDVDNGEAELLTIDENLEREELIEAERLIFLARRKELYVALHPETAQGGDHTSEKAKRQNVVLLSFSDDTAEKTGQSARTIQRDTAIGEALDDKAVATIAGTPTADSKSELKALAELPPAEQRKVAKAVASGKAKSIREATPQSGQPKKGSGDPFKSLENYLGHSLLLISKLPEASKFFRDATTHVKAAMQILRDWKIAVKQ